MLRLSLHLSSLCIHSMKSRNTSEPPHTQRSTALLLRQRRGGEAAELQRHEGEAEESRGGGVGGVGGYEGHHEIKRKMSAYTSQFRRTVLHGVAAPNWLLNGELALVRERRGGLQHRVLRRFALRDSPARFFSVRPPFRL